MAKIPIALLLCDLHLHKDNIQSVKSIWFQAHQCCLKNKIEVIYLLGDIVDSRKGQPQSVLNAFGDMLEDSEIRKICFPGNHDKVDYESERSYLDEFKYHPKFELIDAFTCFHLVENSLVIHFIPYFKEGTIYSKYFKEAIKVTKLKYPKGTKHILLTHIAVTGVSNNDGELVDTPVKPKDFAKFNSVLVGHYHNQSKVGKNIYYIGSVQPKNYGEDNDKGFTILYSDGSHKFVKAEFKEYHTIKIDINRTSQEKLNGLLKRYKDSEHNIRFKFHGSSNKLDTIDINKFKQVGIDIKIDRPKVVEGIINSQKKSFTSFNKTSIKKEFKQFCKTNKLKSELGEKYLNKILRS